MPISLLHRQAHAVTLFAQDVEHKGVPNTCSLVHLHLIFAGVVCILSLTGRQEHCPFTTRLRVLKMGRIHK